MKQTFIIEQSDLIRVLAAMLPICTKRTPIDATASLYMQVRQREIIIKSTDLEVALQASCSIDSTSALEQEPITMLVPGKRLHDIVKELEGQIACEITVGAFTLTANGVVIQLNTADSNQFPPFPERIENMMHIETTVLSELLKGVSFVIPQQHATQALTGLLWEAGPEGVVLTGTDGHCLAQTASAKCVLAHKQQWLLPRRAVLELQKLLELISEKTIFIGTCGKHIVFSGEIFNFFTRLLVGQYPQYHAIMKHDDFKSARVERLPFLKTLRRSATLLSGQFIATEFTFNHTRLEATLHNKEVGSLREEIRLEEYTGGPLTMRCYAPYILHGLHAFSEETSLTVYLKNATAPLVLVSERSTGTRMTYLVMPVAQVG